MKILLVRSNPRKSGHTQHLLDILVDSARKQNAIVTDVNLTTMGIKPCIGCYHCWTGTPGVCIQKDGMAEILAQYLESDLLICATPLYAYAVSSYLKIFLERTMPLLAPGATTDVHGSDRNEIRYPGRGPCMMAAVIVGGLRDIHHSDGALGSLRQFAEGVGLEFAGALIRPESSLLSFVDAKPKSIKTIETAFEQAGWDLAQGKILSEEIRKKASTPLSADHEGFVRYSKIFWEHAVRVAQSGRDVLEAIPLVNRDIRILMSEMARSADPTAIRSTRASIQFDFPDHDLHYHLQFADYKCIIRPVQDAADLKITCSTSTWASVILRELDPMKALIEKAISLEGDKMLFRRLGRYFPPPNN